MRPDRAYTPMPGGAQALVAPVASMIASHNAGPLSQSV